MKTRIIQIDPRELKLLPLNARYMRHEEYQQLVANIKRDGQLTSAPFACKEGDKYLVLSGNHRTQAAIAAGLETIACIVTDDELSEDQKISIQLSHNSLVGKDDPYILKELYDKILDIDWKEYSGLDDKTLENLDKMTAQSLKEANLVYQTIGMVFLPDELSEAKKVIDDVKKSAKSVDETWLTTNSQYDDWLDAQETVQSVHGVKNVATAVDIILKIFKKNITQLQECYDRPEDDKKWVPLETIVGRNKIPAKTAKKLAKAVQKIQGAKNLKEVELWRTLDVLADKYLAGE